MPVGRPPVRRPLKIDEPLVLHPLGDESHNEELHLGVVEGRCEFQRLALRGGRQSLPRRTCGEGHFVRSMGGE